MSRRAAAIAVLTLAALPAAPAAARDYASTALNIIPSGQFGQVPVPAGADMQARMYDALTPLRGDVDAGDLRRTFKSARLGAAPPPRRVEAVPRKGVRIVRDRFDVPHITGRTYADVVWAMGWVLQEDRGLLLAQGRGPGRLAALDAPGIRAFDLVTSLTPFTPSAEADRRIDREQERNLRAAGPDGRAVLRQIDLFTAGINARLKAEGSTAAPFRRTDIFGFVALAGELFGRGGGDEARRSTLLDALRDRVGAPRADAIFDDVAATDDPDRPDSLPTRFPYEPPGGARKGNVVLDAGSVQPTSFASAPAEVRGVPHASNFLMVSGRRSTTGHPIFVAGPQIGYFYPGLTLEADIAWPGHAMRGIYSPAHPGVIFIGRGEDFAYSLTSAGNDTADEYVETLCGGSDAKYLFRGQCRDMETIDAGTVGTPGTPVRFRQTVHGPVTGYATVDGRRVAIAQRRSSAGRDALWTLPFRDATLGRVRSAEDLFRAADRQPYTFNVAYADADDIAMFSAGRLPVRPRGIDPRLPVDGRGAYEWRGFLPRADHPQGKNPPTGALLNWNNRPAPGFAAADNDWEHGPLHRNRLLEDGIARRRRHSPASVVGAMNRAATQDLRSFGLTPDLERLLRGTTAPNPRTARMLELLSLWRQAGSARLDADLDGVVDAGPAPAIWDELYPRLVDAVLGPVMGPQLELLRTLVGRTNSPATGFTGGAINHVDKALRTATGTRFRRPLRVRWCGQGDLAACRQAVWAALDGAGAALEAAQGTADPQAWRAQATRTSFAPGVAPFTIRYTNRPSGIQQVVSFAGRRPGSRR
jgi:acyl-homoserine lactone acylase PvdQ